MGDFGLSEQLVEMGPGFHPRQIVCLEHAQTRLYAEIVQVVTTRQRCWARPLVLMVASPPPGHSDQSSGDRTPTTHDLRQGADLVWPAQLFRAALDTEVLAFLPLLYEAEARQDSQTVRLAHQQLHQFINQVWKAYPQAFQD